MKKTLISSFFVVAFAAYAAYSHFSETINAQQPLITVSNGMTGSAPPTDTAPIRVENAPPLTAAPARPIAVQAAPAPKAPTGKYADGTYTGSAVDAYYGTIQVNAVISGGKLADVVFLQYPNDRSTSRFINQQAMPELKAEAIQAQSANVDGVSGASDSSAAFKESLSSALSQART